MRKEAEELIIEKLRSWDYCKKKLLICVAPKNTLTNCITFPYLDLDAYVRIIIYVKEGEAQGSCRVNETILNEWGIDKNELFSAAMECSNNKYFTHTMSEIFGIQTEIEQVVVRVEYELYGAGALMFTTTVLQDVANFFDSDLILLPSSIHEIICMSVNDVDLESASRLVKEVNDGEVSEEDRLSDHAYSYHRDSQIITW
jgi:hypothetical protein